MLFKPISAFGAVAPHGVLCPPSARRARRGIRPKANAAYPSLVKPPIGPKGLRAAIVLAIRPEGPIGAITIAYFIVMI
jgi:hypothetical protein